MRQILAAALLFAGFSSGCALQKAAADANSPASLDKVTCGADPRVRVYHAGIAARGVSGIYNFVLAGASQVPPLRGVNSFTVQVQDLKGQAVNNATLSLKPWMPDQDQGPTMVPQVTVNGASYSATHIDFFQAGVWQLVFSATGPAGTDTATFTFCVDG